MGYNINSFVIVYYGLYKIYSKDMDEMLNTQEVCKSNLKTFIREKDDERTKISLWISLCLFHWWSLYIKKSLNIPFIYIILNEVMFPMQRLIFTILHWATAWTNILILQITLTVANVYKSDIIVNFVVIVRSHCISLLVKRATSKATLMP